VRKTTLSALVFAAGASALLAQEPAKPAATKPDVQLQAEVVSVDAQARTVVVKPASASQGQSQEQATLSVDTKATTALQGLHAGDQVTLTCKPSSYGSGSSDQQSGPARFAKACGTVTGIAQSSTH
jgi:hypothetical protein